jgi:hypothetical protein
MARASWCSITFRPRAATIRESSCRRACDSRSCPRTPLLETSWRREPLRTAAAYLLKAPAQVDARVRPTYRGTLDWPFVGGWEIVMQRA